MVILDRDGVLNELVVRPGYGGGESPLSSAEVRLVGGVTDSLKQLRAAGYLLACVTNQPSAAKCLASIDEVHAVHQTVFDLLRADGVVFDAVQLCPHHPQALRPELRGPCSCRKPAPGMLLEVLNHLDAAAAASWMIGDTDSDVLAGRAAGVRTVLVHNPASSHKQSGRVHPDYSVADLNEAVPVIINAAPLESQP